MVGAAWVRWVFAAMFAANTLFSVVRLIATGRDASVGTGTADRSVDVSRGVMSLGMVAMLVPWVDPLPRLYWQVLFGVAAGHVAVRLIRRSVRSAPLLGPGLGEHHELHLVIGGLAMVYMLAAMPPRHATAGSAERMDMAGMGSTGLALPALTWAFIAYFLVFVVRLGARLAMSGNTLAQSSTGPLPGTALGAGPRGMVISPHLLGSSEVVMGIGMSYMLMTML
ncbi:MAG TPA: DUF5134 domain-containing protein [Pseudonocardiaceae bacterium]|jgi:hypothetical protein|nr:DUF5134 domain-containing protein [Pseudonocardiaceae bacterium]